MALPFFKFYPLDFASDGKVEAMSTEEVGAYILLLCKAWREQPAGSIPDDDVVLSRWVRLTPGQWTRCRDRVLAAFAKGDDGRWHQARMQREWADVAVEHEVRSKAGRKGAMAKHSKESGNATAMPQPSHGNATAEPEQGHGISDVRCQMSDSEQIKRQTDMRVRARERVFSAIGRLVGHELTSGELGQIMNAISALPDAVSISGTDLPGIELFARAMEHAIESQADCHTSRGAIKYAGAIFQRCQSQGCWPGEFQTGTTAVTDDGQAVQDRVEAEMRAKGALQ